jgi:cyanate permease
MVFGKRNVLLLVAGILVVVVGYLFLGRGSITLAPILLVLGYCVIIPLSIILWVKKPERSKRPDDTIPPATGE